MRSRTAFGIALLVLAAAAVGLVRCGEDPRPRPEETADRPAADDAPPGDAAPTRRRVRAPRGGGPVTGRRGETPPYGVLAARGERPIPPVAPFVEAPVDAGPPAPHGRVRALMLKDGKPFAGGHVCFFPEEAFRPSVPWDGVSGSDAAYMAVPWTLGLFPGHDPVLGGWTSQFESERGITDADGRITLDVPTDRTLVVFVRYRESGIPLKSFPRVHLADGEEVDVTIEASTHRTIRGVCTDADGRALSGVVLQALDPLDELPVSRLVNAANDGSFLLDVFGDQPEVHVRAACLRLRGIHTAEKDVPAIPAPTTVVGVVPGGEPLEIRLPFAPRAFVEVTLPEGDTSLVHVQIELLSFDPRVSAWVRLGGPQYNAASAPGASRTRVIGVTPEELSRPIMLWSWGWTITAVDGRGRDRVTVPLTRGRRIAFSGRGWEPNDHVRVIAHLGPPGATFPCVWIDTPLPNTGSWARDDSPVAAVDIQIVRAGVVVARSPTIPAGTEPVTDVVLDVR